METKWDSQGSKDELGTNERCGPLKIRKKKKS